MATAGDPVIGQGVAFAFWMRTVIILSHQCSNLLSKPTNANQKRLIIFDVCDSRARQADVPMIPDMTLQTPLALKRRSMNTVVNEFPALSATHFICAAPRQAAAITVGLCLSSACALIYLATSASTLPSVAIWILGMASALPLVALPSARSSIHYASDTNGVYFPSRQFPSIGGRAKRQTWLLVPWSNISRIRVQPLLDESGRKGVAFCLRVSDEERRLYFPRAATLDLGDEPRASAACSILVAYPSAFKSPHKIAAILCNFQRHSEVDNGRNDLAPVSNH